MWFSKKPERVYLDFASATPVCKAAQHAMAEALSVFGNPGSIHAEGVIAKKALLAAREKLALELGVKSRQFIFVSGGSEANNLAILGVARRRALTGSLAGTHWITTEIEHPSVLECFSEIERLGGTVTHLKPDGRGLIPIESLTQALRKETVLVSIAWANHELGVVQPISGFAKAIRAHEAAQRSVVYLHTDAAQVPLYKPAQLNSLDADIVTLDSGKLYGPRGIGALFISNRVEMAPLILGGGQERGLRAGTENVALAAGFAAAVEYIGKDRHAEAKRVEVLRDALMKGILAAAPEVLINGEVERSLPHMLNISLPGVSSEYLTLSLDAAGIAVATKSACREGEEQVSRVIEALGGPEWRAKNTLRISLGRSTTDAHIRKATEEFTRLLQA